MAASSLFISEYSGTAMKNAQTIGSVRQPSLADSQFTVSAASAQSPAFNAATSIVRLSVGGDVSTGVCLKFGTNPTAVATGGIRMSGGQSEYFVVNGGDKVAAILSTN